MKLEECVTNPPMAKYPNEGAGGPKTVKMTIFNIIKKFIRLSVSSIS